MCSLLGECCIPIYRGVMALGLAIFNAKYLRLVLTAWRGVGVQ
jgi:hypothetical protein